MKKFLPFFFLWLCKRYRMRNDNHLRWKPRNFTYFIHIKKRHTRTRSSPHAKLCCSGVSRKFRSCRSFSLLLLEFPFYLYSKCSKISGNGVGCCVTMQPKKKQQQRKIPSKFIRSKFLSQNGIFMHRKDEHSQNFVVFLGVLALEMLVVTIAIVFLFKLHCTQFSSTFTFSTSWTNIYVLIVFGEHMQLTSNNTYTNKMYNNFINFKFSGKSSIFNLSKCFFALYNIEIFKRFDAAVIFHIGITRKTPWNENLIT